MHEALRKIERRRKSVEDLKTYDEVFDKATLLLLTKLISRHVIDTLDFPIATGKEANVFRASRGEQFYALKIYRTSTATFKDLTKYIAGDPRFDGLRGRRIVYVWARKEYKNLQRMFEIGIPVPRPIICRDNVLVMEYIGTESEPAPMLKDCEVAQPRKLLNTLIRYLRVAYRTGQLVHGDMSEYNVLMHNGTAMLIDVGQSVLLRHPMAEAMLERDVSNLARYFRKLGVDIPTKNILRRIRGVRNAIS